ncbi:cathepsin B-like [Cylas formicarius]|uniref:cathepsin B-like n=1 Tax=Cylas formicarius TaxID=197179 RepID=UPI00295886AF|nr:cathepsin B-like [Cylas formicarius]
MMHSCRFAFLFATILVAAGSKLHPLSDEYVAEINRKHTTWKAERVFDDWDTFKMIASGVVKRPLSERTNYIYSFEEDSEIPDFFDAAEAWPKCESIKQIRDQSKCGACWAFAAVQAMSDRICIHSGQTKQVYISAQDLLTCCERCGDGCFGGDPFSAWDYWWSNGIVTGGLYNAADQGCKSYFLSECDDHPNKCRDYVGTPQCVKTCDDRSRSYNDSLAFGELIKVFIKEEDIQREIMNNGPVEATYTVYEDFASYKSGIYQPTTDVEISSHAVKIVGWGVEDGVKYWKIANSWNTRWGEDGYFRMIRGVNSSALNITSSQGLLMYIKSHRQ